MSRFSKFQPLSVVRPVAAGAILLAGLCLGGCSTPMADLPGIGLPENTPPRPATPAAYLPVHDLPPPRAEPVLTPEEQQKIQKELTTARDRQAGKQSGQRTAQ